MNSAGFCLGIDLGTTSVKVSLVDRQSKSLIVSTSETTDADIANGAQKSEQDASKIMKAICACLTRITDKNRSCVKCVCVTGQMHGLMLWNSEMQNPLTDGELDASYTSNLYTWQDQRACREFIVALPKPDSHQDLASGFGCVTLFWLKQFEPELLVQYNTAGGIMDYLVTMLCGLDKPVMSDQIASSWGYFCSQSLTWNTEILKEAGFPVHFLPVVVSSGTQAGALCKDWFGIPKGTPVLAGLGDLQCSFVSGSEQGKDAVMNISTSSQLCYQVLSSGFFPQRCQTQSAVSYFPFFREKFLAVAASLNGGNSLSAFVRMLQSWFSMFEVTMSKEDIWKKLTELSANTSCDSSNAGLVIQPLLFGERHDPTLTGSLSGATEQTLSLDCVFRALCEGLVSNLHHMMPVSKLIESGITRLILTGSVVDRQPCVIEYVRKLYSPLTVIQKSGLDSAIGAALVACTFLETLA